jgi:hypothetical protein
MAGMITGRLPRISPYQVNLERARVASLGIGGRTRIIQMVADLLAKPAGKDEREIAAIVNGKLGWTIDSVSEVKLRKTILDGRLQVGEFMARGRAAGQEARLAIVVPRLAHDTTLFEAFQRDHETASRLEASRIFPRAYCCFNYYYDPGFPGSPGRIPVLVREFLPGETLSETIEKRSFSARHLLALGKTVGRILSIDQSLLPHNIAADHVVFSKAEGYLTARVCGINQQATQNRPLDLLKNCFETVRTKYETTLEKHGWAAKLWIRLFVRGIKSAAPPDVFREVLADAKEDLQLVNGEIEYISLLPRAEQAYKSPIKARLTAMKTFFEEIST